MSLIEEKVIDQFSEIASTPLKNFMETKNIRKNMLAKYGTQKEIELIEQVMSSDSVSVEHKALLTAYIKNGAKKFYNQLKILDIALDKLENKRNKIINIDEEWINDFWEKAKNISNEETQNIWGSVLYFNFLNGTCTKTLLNSLYLIEKRGINDFDLIRKFTFQQAKNPIRVYSCIYFIDESRRYRDLGLHKYGIHYLSTLGLVEYDWNHKFVLPSQRLCLKYGNRIIKIKSNERLEYGNVRLTSDGSLLFNALQPEYDEECFDFCLSKWKEHDNVVIEEVM